jgi:PAS domain S-box-containing protein
MGIPKSVRTRLEAESKKTAVTKRRRSDNHSLRAKHCVKQSSDETEFLFNNISDAVRVINSDFTIRRINRAFAEMTGVDQDMAVEKKCWEIFPSIHCHTAECRLQCILDGTQGIQVEIERKKKDGTTIPCLVTTSPLVDETGTLTGIIEQFRDITEHRQMEKQVKESEDRYRALVELDTEAGEAIVMLQILTVRKAYKHLSTINGRILQVMIKTKLLGTCFLI